MSTVRLYAFRKGPNIYVVSVDPATNEISFVIDNDATGYYTEQPYNGSPLPIGYCQNTTYTTYKTIINEPYAAILNSEANSSMCGYSPAGNINIDSIAVTNETAYGANDGSALPSVSGGTAPYVFSIDGVNFSPLTGEPIVDLAPGDYTLSIHDSTGVVKQQSFTVDAYTPVFGCTDPAANNYNPEADIDNGTCVYPSIDDSSSRANIYEAVDEFRLIDSAGHIYEIDMPGGWDKVIFKLERDKQYHGVNYEFTDGEVQLDFDLPAGKEILQAEYDTNGNDGFMQFQFGMVYPDGTFFPDIDAYIDFNTKTNDRDIFSVSIKRKTFNDAIETKNEIDVTLKDGYFTLPLHSKQINKQVLINRTAQISNKDSLGINEVKGANPNGSTDGDSPWLTYWTFLDLSQPKNTDPGYSSYVNDLATEAPLFGTTQSNPVQTLQYLFKTDGAGPFTLNFDFSMKISTKVTQSPIQTSTPRQGKWSYAWFICVNDFSNKHIMSFVGGSTNSIYVTTGITTKYNITLNLNQGDRVYVFGQYVCEHRGGAGFESTLLMDYTNIKITGGTTAQPTTTPAKLAFEVGQDILKSITGGTAKLVSNLLGRTDLGYGENGCAALIAYTNGYLIRGFPLAQRPIIIQFKDFIEGLDANYCIGLGYELDDQNNWIYRIEQFEYFYKDVLIMTFTDVSDYKENIDQSLIFNELEFGYQKYTQDLESVSTLDEFLTEHKLQTPIESYKGTLTRVCKQVASGYAIELARRLQYGLDPTKSYTYDEDNFIISTVPDSEYKYRTERLDNFTASGIVSPETAYNIRLAISRMLARWAKFINSGLAFKTNAATIANTYVAKNGDLTSQYTGDQACESKVKFTESDDLLKGDLANGEQKFFPETIEFTTRLSWSVIRDIRRCFCNKDPKGRNNGYFGVIDGDGNTKYGYLMSVEYNPLGEKAQFVLRKKYVDLNEPFDCTDYSNFTFGDFEAATGLPKEIEQCLFENFA